MFPTESLRGPALRPLPYRNRRGSPIAALCFALTLAAGATSASAQDPRPVAPGDLAVEVELDTAVQHLLASDTLVQPLRIRLQSRADHAIAGWVRIGPLSRPPPVPGTAMEPFLARLDERAFKLSKGGRTEIETTVHIPGAPAPARLILPLSLRGARVRTGSNPDESMEYPPYQEQLLYLTRTPDWRVVGPFPNDEHRGFSTSYPPESAREPEGSYASPGRERVTWAPLAASALTADGMVDFQRHHGGNTDDQVYYAWISVRSPARQDVVLHLGSDDTLTVWHDRRRIHSHETYRAAARSQDQVPLRLEEGNNSFLFKVCNDDGGFGLYFEVKDPAGRPADVHFPWTVRGSGPPDPELRVLATTQSSAELSWFSQRPAPSVVQITRVLPGRADPARGLDDRFAMLQVDSGASPRELRDEELSNRHTATLSGLQPATRYLVTFQEGGSKHQLSFYTRPPEGRKMALRLRLAVLFFTNVTEEGDDSEGPEHPPRVNADFIARAVEDMQQTVRFYWINSGMNLLLEPLFLEDDTPYRIRPGTHAGLGFAAEGGIEYEALNRTLTRVGLKATDFDGVLFVSCDKSWDAARKAFTFPASGGLTSGPTAPFNVGKSGWKGGADNSWLFCHEFHHQLDALYAESGMPEFLFNHFQPWDDTAHRHGEHWDGNAWTLREWAGHVTRERQSGWLPGAVNHRYFTNLWGEVLLLQDADRDGIPDQTPQVPLDERRFGSSSVKADSDGDGLSDLAEAMASQWLERGHAEVFAGAPGRHHLDPTAPDSDGDGVPDGTDPEPLHPYATRIAFAGFDAEGHPRIRFDGLPGEAGWTWFGKLEDEEFSAEVHIAWEAETLYLGLTADRVPEAVRLRLDANDDGWFVGADNLEIQLRPGGGLPGDWPGDADRSLTFALHNAGVPGVWPFYDAEAVEGAEFQLKQVLDENGRWSAELAIPRDPATGRTLSSGEEWGVSIALDPPPPFRGDPLRPWLTMMEPHCFLRIRLIR